MPPSSISAPRPSSLAGTLGFALAGVILVATQFVLSYQLRYHNFFNDDLEHIAYGRFFSSLYTRQFNVHMPLGAFLAFLWGQIFGFTVSVHRMLAATLNGCILVTLLYLGRRYFSRSAGIVAALAWLLLEVPLWAYMHLSEVPSVLFMLLGTVAVLRLELTPELTGPRRAWLAFCVGALFGLAVMARLMAVEVFALVVLLVTVQRVLGRERGAPWFKRLAMDSGWVTLGLALPLLAFVGLFAALGTLNDFIYWTLLHNLKAKSALNPAAWIGDLEHPSLQILWLFAICAVVISTLGYWVYWRPRGPAVRTAMRLAWTGALGGWLGANPSGIGQMAFHAIPAFPFLCLAAGAGVTGLVHWALASRRSWRLLTGAVAALAVLGLGATLRLSHQATWKLAKHAPFTSHFARTDAFARYIRDNSRPEETVFVFGTSPLIYAASERGSATTFSIVFMDVVRYEEEMLAQLRGAPPRFVVMDPTDFWFSHNVRTMPRVRDYLLENYRMSPEFPELLEPRAPGNEQRVFRHSSLPGSIADTNP